MSFNTQAVVTLSLSNSQPLLDRAVIRAVELACQPTDQETTLMQRAGEAAARWIQTLTGNNPHPILFLIGPGNNGGDALVCARLLMAQGYDCLCVGYPMTTLAPTDAQAAYAAFLAAGGVLHPEMPRAQRFSLMVDGLFGIGLNQPLRAPYADWVTAANTYSTRDGIPLLALDIASGLHSDSGSAEAICICATHTLTFIALKPGLLTGAGPDHSGAIRVCDLQIAPNRIAQIPVSGFTNAPALWQHTLPRRTRNSHKGDAGCAGLLGGAPSMNGALVLAARSAIHCGAGRVYAASLDNAHGPFDPLQPEIMYRTTDTLYQAPLTALAIGPGLGQSTTAHAALIRALDFPGPLVLDADALRRLPDLRPNVLARTHPTLLTPHPGEAAALLQTTTADISANRIEAAQRIATLYQAFVVLKGCGSIIVSPEGRWWINPTGNPGMATAGMGDVLTGIITAFLAQAMPPQAALLAAVWVHGAAADACVSHHQGPLGLTASEVILASRRLLNTLTNHDTH